MPTLGASRPIKGPARPAWREDWWLLTELCRTADRASTFRSALCLAGPHGSVQGPRGRNGATKLKAMNAPIASESATPNRRVHFHEDCVMASLRKRDAGGMGTIVSSCARLLAERAAGALELNDRLLLASLDEARTHSRPRANALEYAHTRKIFFRPLRSSSRMNLRGSGMGRNVGRFKRDATRRRFFVCYERVTLGDGGP